MEHARAWWASPEYAAAKALRHESAHSILWLVEGVPATTPVTETGESPACAAAEKPKPGASPR
ncbi:DUF1330 domain-containing protein [Myxococcus sp. SDU36]|uniref:DUF1330 domain-containing protein n=1 Tax=Myxococcus sp. SDU36 TaxID=2831967 RepID=UPI0032ECB52F